MRLAWAIVLVASGCKGILGIDDPALANSADAGADAAPDAPIDALSCYGTVEPICFDAPPTGTIQWGTPFVIDTSDDANCTRVLVAPARCVVAVDTVFIESTGSYIAVGSRPLVLVAATSIRIDGALDVSSEHRTQTFLGRIGAGSNVANCTNADAVVGSNAGGAGGSFRTTGGAGGRGSGSAPGTAAQAATTEIGLRGGCTGGFGDGNLADGGPGGGAVLLVSPVITVAGSVNASGAAGRGGGTTTGSDGGGGGGAGGTIIFDTSALTITGAVLADGGGGGEASGFAMRGVDGSEADVAMPNRRPVGGSSAAGPDGGDGAREGSGANGREASGNGQGGGGGGGGGGLIRIAAPNATISGTIYPPAITD